MGKMTKGIVTLTIAMLLTAEVSFAGPFDKETVGERFRNALKEIEAACAKRKLEPNEVCGAVTKLKPADPLATEEGRFAHSIKIPSPVLADSGYKPGMTSQEYFDHLCKTEAGEFIYKTVDGVAGIYQMRPRHQAPDAANHLYALEDPYGGPEGSSEPEFWLVEPSRYNYFESPELTREELGGRRGFWHPSYFSIPSVGSKVARYSGYDGHEFPTMRKEYDVTRKSRYGYTWRGITRPRDREMGVAGSELLVLDLRTNEVLGVQRGYARFDIDKNVPGTAAMQWSRRCPAGPNMGGGARLSFILKILTPTSGSQGK